MQRNKGRGKRSKRAFQSAVCDDKEESGDILKPYYDSRLPAEEEGLASDPASATPSWKEVATVRADELIKLAASQLTTHERTQHLMLENADILWLHAGGNPSVIFEEKLRSFGEVTQLKIFPRHCFACVTFMETRHAAQAQLALNNHTVYCNTMTVSFLTSFLSRDAIMACQGSSAATPQAGTATTAAQPPPALQSTRQLADDAAGEVDDYMSFLLGD